jgi:hypothetical protein
VAFLNAGERRTLQMICDTLMPALESGGRGEDPQLFGLSAADVGLAAEVEAALEAVTGD